MINPAILWWCRCIGAAGVAVGSILPLPGRPKVATPLGKAPGHCPQPRQQAEPLVTRVRRQCGRARHAVTTSPGLGFEQFKAHDFIVGTLGPCGRTAIEGRTDPKEV